MIHASSKENQKDVSRTTYVKGTRGVSVDFSVGNIYISRLITTTDQSEGIESTQVGKQLMEKEKIHSLSPERKPHPGDKFLLPPQAGSKIGMKTLILDLDETLIHSSFQKLSCNSDFVLKIEAENNLTDIHVVKRPGVDEFLSRVAKCYEVVIFTASLAKYADQLIDLLDPDKLCSYRLFREHCTHINGLYIKELKRLNRNMKSVILLDNNPASYYLDNENGIPIKTFYDDQTDCELVQMAYVLEKLSKVSDVRPFLKEIVYMNQINYDRAYELFHQQTSREEIKENTRFEGNADDVEANEKKLKVLSVELIKSQEHPTTAHGYYNKNTTNTGKSQNASGKVMTVSNNFRNISALSQTQANLNLNLNLNQNPGKKILIGMTNKNNISVSANNKSKTLSGSKKPLVKPSEKINVNLLKSVYKSSTQPKEESNTKRPSSVIPLKSQQIIDTNKSIKNTSSGKTSTAQSTEIHRNFSFASLPSHVKKPKQIEVTTTTSSVTLQSKLIKGSSTTRFNESEVYRNKSNEEYKVRVNPVSARANTNLLNFKKENKERPNSSNEKFNSLAFTKKESSTQHSTSNSLSKSKMCKFNTSHSSIPGKKTSSGRCDLKFKKIIPNNISTVNRCKNGKVDLKGGDKTK